MPVSYALCAGHLTADVYPHGPCAGGGALYGALALARAGAPDVRLVAVAGPDSDALEGMHEASRRLRIVLARDAHTTTFRNDYEADSGARVQWVETIGRQLEPADVPRDWPAPELLLLAPVLGELALEAWLDAFGATPFVALAAQGWFKRARPARDGQARAVRVAPRRWPYDPQRLRERVHLVSCSREDLAADPGAPERLASVVPVVAVTDGARGAELFVDGRRLQIAATPATRVVDPTGAGDVFAAILARGLAGGLTAVDAAQRAAQAASHVIADVATAALRE